MVLAVAAYTAVVLRAVVLRGLVLLLLLLQHIPDY
jgi:hypothetical protein